MRTKLVRCVQRLVQTSRIHLLTKPSFVRNVSFGKPLQTVSDAYKALRTIGMRHAKLCVAPPVQTPSGMRLSNPKGLKEMLCFATFKPEGFERNAPPYKAYKAPLCTSFVCKAFLLTRLYGLSLCTSFVCKAKQSNVPAL